MAALALLLLLVQEDEAVDHAALIRGWNGAALERGRAIYAFSCAPCHGDDGLNPRNPNSRRFAADPLRFGAEPERMFQTLTNGVNEMPSQTWLTPEQRYEVIHYVRESFFKEQNPSMYFEVDERYLAGLPKPAPGVRRPAPRPPMDYGPAMSYELGDLRSALVVRLSENLTIAYDLPALAAPAVWKNGFVNLADTHHTSYKGGQRGRIQGTRLPLGEWRWLGDAPVEYLGHFLHGASTVLDYSVDGRAILETPGFAGRGRVAAVTHTLRIGPGERPLRLAAGASSNGPPAAIGRLFAGGDSTGRVAAAVVGRTAGTAWSSDAHDRLILTIPPDREPRVLAILRASLDDDDALESFAALVGDARPPVDPETQVHGGPARWGPALETSGTLGAADGAYAIDAIGVPFENPWHSWMRLTAFDLFPDGRLAVSTLNGDVWIVSGLERASWRRFAAGLYEPLGLKVVDGRVLVLGRDRITRLHDLDGDGEADRYESFHAFASVSGGYHAFNFDLQTDREGNLYYTRSGRKTEVEGNGALVKVSPDGRSSRVLATGFRHPNGMTVDPQGRIYVGDNQGEWMPASKVSLVREGGFYGYEPGPGQRERFEEPILWLPHEMDSSSAGQLRAGDPRWGPLAGRLLHLSYGRARLFVLFEQEVGGRTQAAAVPFGGPFESGLMRARVSPVDGAVWLLGHRGWDTKVKADGCLVRLRPTGGPARLVTGARVERGGVRLEFGVPLSAGAADPKRYDARGWNYLYSEKYGSKNYRVADPAQEGVDELRIASAALSADRRAVTLAIPQIAPMDQLRVTLSVPTEDGATVEQTVLFTIHAIPP